jgi:starch phosphorylase
MSILADGMVKMAWLAITACHSVNGVAALHTEILKSDVLRDWYEIWPEKFNNKTNGVTQRRWLKKANPGLADLLDETIGTGWTGNMSGISEFGKFADDGSVLDRLGDIKLKNKTRLAQTTLRLTGIKVDPSSLFDVQVKRLHEYKRQLLNILSVIHDWQILKDNPGMDMPPRTVFFGAKAASGYRRAKQVIHLIHCAAEKINSDKASEGRIRVVFIPDYKVSVAEIIFPGSELSQQISTAGKEASGTGNMKFMMNGAITLGTMDGANIEIVEEAGPENAFIFGMSTDEVEALKESGTYNPWEILAADPALKRALETLIDGTLGSDEEFRELYDSLLYGVEGNTPDEYFVLQDFASYRETRAAACHAWKDPRLWNRMALKNIAGSGKFSSDRTISEYARDVWDIKPRR